MLAGDRNLYIPALDSILHDNLVRVAHAPPVACSWELTPCPAQEKGVGALLRQGDVVRVTDSSKRESLFLVLFV